MAYRVAVCDDSSEDARYVAGMVQAWASSRDAALQVERFPSAEAFLFHYAEDQSYDMLLLDIEMGGMNGVELARRIRRENEIIQIIFITGYSDYIAEGYDVAALHYLMKPLKEEKLFSVLDRAAEKLRSNERVLTLNLPGEICRVPLYQIRYLDVRLNYVTVHAREDIAVKMPLSRLTALLDERFYQVGRSLTVNLYCISRVTRTEILLQDGTALLLPRGAYEGVNRAIINLR